MRFLNLHPIKKSGIASCLLVSSFCLQPAIGCSVVNDEFTKLENEWTIHCEINSGWGETGNESFCFLTWKSLQAFGSENDSCFTQRNEDVLRKEDGTT